MTKFATRRIVIGHLVLIAGLVLAGFLMTREVAEAATPPTLSFACQDPTGQLFTFNGARCPIGYTTIDFSPASPSVTACAIQYVNTMRVASSRMPCTFIEQTVILHGPTETLVCANLIPGLPFPARLMLANANGTCRLGATLLRIPPSGPVAANDSYITGFETALTVSPPGVLANDTLNSGSVSSFDAVSANGGAVALNPDGGFTYTPPTGFAGTDSFGYTISNGASASSATVTIEVIHYTVANNDDFFLRSDFNGTIPAPGVLANDEVNGATITAYDSTTAQGGSVTLNQDGTFTYVAPSSPVQSDSFSYTLTNLVGSSTATVTLTFNQPPDAIDDSVTTDENTPATGNVLTNDTDADNHTLTVAAVNGSAANVGSQITLPSGALLTVNSDGSFTWNPNGVYDGLAAGEQAADSFAYTASDGFAGTDSATVTITITGVNDAPVTVDDSYSVNEDESLSVPAPGVLGNDTDVDGEGLSAVLVSGPAQAASFTLNADGSFTYTPNVNVNGSDSFTYKANDGTADSNVATVTITITPVNDAPVATDDSYDTDGIAPLSVTAPGVLANDTDIDGDTLTAVLISGPTQAASFTLNPDGSFTYTPNPGATIDSFTYTANDGQANSNVATVTITINATPVADAQSVSTNEDAAVIITLTGSDADDEDLTFAIASPPSNGTLGTISAADCSAATICSATVEYTPGANFNGEDSFTFTVNDNHIDSTAATVTITVNAINDAPSFTKGADLTVLEDSGMMTVSGWATAISAGPTADEDSQTLTFSVSNDNNALFSVQPDVDEATGNLTFTVAPNMFGSATVMVTLSDNGGTAGGGDDTADPQTFTIAVTAVNDAPSFTPGGNVTVNEDSGPYSAAWAGGISAGPNESGQVLTFNVSADDTSLFSSQPAISDDGTLTFTPAGDASGTTTVTVSLSDDGDTANGGSNTSAPVTFTVTITAINDAPSFTAANPPAVNEDAGAQTVIGWVSSVSTGPANESGQSIIGYTVSNVQFASTLAFDAAPAIDANGTLTYAPAANAYGTATFDVVVQDNGGAANSGQDTSTVQTFTITVNAVNDAPSFTKGADQTVNEDAAPQSVTGWATNISAGPNESGQTLTFVVSNDNSGLFSSQPSVSSNGTLTYTPAANKNGTATVSVTLTDNGGTDNGGVDTTVTQTFTVTVTPVNDAPTAVSQNYNAQTNMRLSISGNTQGGGLLVGANDPDANDPGFTSTLTIGSVSATTPTGGNVSVNSSTGAFDFDPPPGVTGNVTFTYTVCDNGNPMPSLCSAPQTVTVAVSGTVIWFVNPTATTNGNGTLASPFKFLSGQTGASPANDADDVDAANHRIFLYSGTAASGITLNASEWLIGQGAFNSPTNTFDALFGVNPPAGTIARPTIGGARPTISPSAGTAVTLSTDNRLQGFNVNAPAGVIGSNVDALTVSQVGLTSTSGSALDIASGTAQMNVALDSVSASSGASVGVRATDNSMGTLVITGAANTITATTGTALTITNTTIGATAVTFQSISVNGAVNGIVLNNTGTVGGLSVTGSATANSGGSIQNTTSHGISLTNTRGPSFNRMNIQSTGGSGVRGSSVTNFTFTNGTINNSGTGGGNQESSIAFNDPTGSATDMKVQGVVTITGNTLTNALWHGVSILQFAGTLDDVNISNNTITSGLTTGSGGNSFGSGIQLFAGGVANSVASVVRAELNNNVINNFPGGVLIAVQGGTSNGSGPTGSFGTPSSSTDDIEIIGNILNGGGSSIRPNQVVLATVNGRGVGNFNIQNNGSAGDPLSGSAGNIIDISAGGSVTVKATVSNNRIDASGQTVSGTSGIAAGVGPFTVTDTGTLSSATLYATVQNNNIANSAGSGIRLNVNAGDPTLNAIVTGNTVGAPISATYGIQVVQGNNAGFTGNTNLQISGNTSTGGAGGGNTFPGIGLRKFGTATGEFNIVGLSPSPATNLQMESFVATQNTSASGTFGTNGVAAVNGSSSNWTAITSVPTP